MNLEVCKCLNLAQGWDVSCVVGTAYQLHHEVLIGNEGYYSLYPNNVPITFVLYKLFNLADDMKDFHYAYDFMWVIVICLMISVTGCFMCVSVKKITQNFATTCIACFLYIACVCITPWKTVPYTDMFAIMFPLLSISLYVFYYYSKNVFGRYTLWFLIFLFGFLGSFNTYSQTVWLLIIFCIPGGCLMEKEKREVCMPILVSMLGIIFYLMLFEARARYLICFLPVIIMTAALGMKQYYEMLKMVVGYLCNKIKNNLPSPP